jgi:hypothetical protein
MTIEQRLYELLSPLVTRLYPITPPPGTATPYTVYLIVAQDPMETHTEGSVTPIKHWEIQFSSYGGNYDEIQGRTQTIIDFLLPFRDDGIKACLLKRRRTILDLNVKLPESCVEFDILEALG